MPNNNSKSQHAKIKMDGAEELTINNFYKMDSRYF